MKKHDVWVLGNFEEMSHYRAVVLLPDELVYGKIPRPMIDSPEKQDQLRREMESQKDPTRMLEVISDELDLGDINKIEAHEMGNVSISGGQRLTFHLFGNEEVQRFIRAMQDRLGDGWGIETKTASAAWVGAKTILGTLGVVAFFMGFYFLIENGVISRAHWLIAIIVNIGGTMPLLVLAGLSLVIGCLFTCLAVANPGQYWVLQPKD